MTGEVVSQRQTVHLAALSTLEQPVREGLVLPSMKTVAVERKPSCQGEAGKGRQYVVAPRPQEAHKHCFSPVSSPDASVGLALFKAETHTILLQSH